MGSMAKTGLKRGSAPAFLLLPATALSLSLLLLVPSADSRADDPLENAQSAPAGDAGNGAIRKVIEDAESSDIQHDWPVAQPLPPPPNIPRMHLNLAWLPTRSWR